MDMVIFRKQLRVWGEKKLAAMQGVMDSEPASANAQGITKTPSIMEQILTDVRNSAGDEINEVFPA